MSLGCGSRFTVKYSIGGALGSISHVILTVVGLITVTYGLSGTSDTFALSPESGSITPTGISSALRSSSVHALTCAALSWME